ncbi:MAG: hypothetical protein L6Q49_04060 [Anaerolineales bacterium]|nr:hypothetical protein [Anaerolineales bacterium]
MGIFEWVKSQTGVWGPALLDIYFRNAEWVNTLLVAYGLLLLLSWQNLARIGDALAGQILEQAGRKIKASSKTKKPKSIRLSDFDLSWEEAISVSRFPFVAKQTDILIHRASPENIRTLITERELIQRCARRLGEMGLRLERKK